MSPLKEPTAPTYYTARSGPVCHHRKDNIGFAGNVCRTVSPTRSLAYQSFGLIPAAIPNSQLISFRDQAMRDNLSHGAETDKSNIHFAFLG